MLAETQEDQETRTMYVVEYKPTGKTFVGDPPIKRGRHGRYESLTEAEVGAEACKKWFNTRIIQARVTDETGREIEPEKKIFGDHVIVWIDEYLFEWDAEKERVKRGVLVKTGELGKCDSQSNTEGNSTQKPANPAKSKATS